MVPEADAAAGSLNPRSLKVLNEILLARTDSFHHFLSFLYYGWWRESTLREACNSGTINPTMILQMFLFQDFMRAKEQHGNVSKDDRSLSRF